MMWSSSAGKVNCFANHKMDTITRGYWISYVESTWITFSDFGCHKVCRKLNLSGSDGPSYYSLQPIESMRKRPHRLASRPAWPLKILASLIDLMTSCLFCGLLPIIDRQHGLLAAVSLWNEFKDPSSRIAMVRCANLYLCQWPTFS